MEASAARPVFRRAALARGLRALTVQQLVAEGGFQAAQAQGLPAG